MHLWQSTLSFFLIIPLLLLNSFLAAKTTSSKATSASKSSASSTLHSARSSNIGKASTQRKKSRKSKAGKKSAKQNVSRIRGQKEIESSRVVEIQSALASSGYFRGETTGQWDQATAEAMRAYQQSNGFKTTGKPDALSLKKLGL